jgi:hypothetical protein
MSSSHSSNSRVATWSFSENRIGKEKNGKEKCHEKNLVSSDGEEEETIGNKSPIVTEVNIKEFKTKTIMY